MGVGKLVEFYGDGDQRPFRGDWVGGWDMVGPSVVVGGSIHAMEVSQKRSLLMKPVSAGIQKISLCK